MEARLPVEQKGESKCQFEPGRPRQFWEVGSVKQRNERR